MPRKRSVDDTLDNDLLNLTSSKKPKLSVFDESRDEFSESEFDDGYDENCYGDEEDRKRLQAMSELEREEILYERFEQREKLMELKEKYRRLGKLKPRKNDTVTNKRSKYSRVAKTEGSVGHHGALSDLKAKREARKESDRRREAEFIESEREREQKMEREREMRMREEESKQETNEEEEVKEPQITLEDLRRIQLLRRKLEKWVLEPYFDEVVKGSAVRVRIGMDNVGQDVYRVGIVDEIIERDTKYKFGGTYTNKYLTLKHGSQAKTFRMSVFSNSPISMYEFEKWVRDMNASGEALPTKQFIEEKYKQIESTRAYVYSEEDVTKRIEAKKKLGLIVQSAKDLYRQKLQLRNEIEICESEGKYEEAEQKKQQLAEIEDQLKQQLAKERTKNKFDVSRINRKNRAQNKSILKKIEIPKQKEEKLDPFARRKTRTNFFFDSATGSGTPKSATPKKEGEDIKSPLKSPGASLKEQHDFDIGLNDLEFDEPAVPSIPIIVPTPPVQPADPNKRSLSVDDYKRRRGLL